MPLQITIPDEMVDRLTERARAEGYASVEEYAAYLLTRSPGLPPALKTANANAGKYQDGRETSVDWETPVEQLTQEQWQARVDDFLKRQRSWNPDFDDSRDSIYD